MELREQDISLRILTRVLPLLDKLRDCGTERDTAGNRTPFFDDYAKLVLVYLFNPLVDSISMLQRAAALPKLAAKLGVKAFSKASFSEAPAAFDPALLRAVVRELAGELRALPADPRLADVKHAISLADGTLLIALPELVETLTRSNRDGSAYHAFRAHTIFDLRTGVPNLMHLTGGSPKGADDERRVPEAAVAPGHLYVADRGYFDERLLDRIVKAGSSHVFRAQDDLVSEVVEERPLTPEAVAAGVLGDRVVRLADLDHPVRLVTVKADVHAKRTRGGTVDSTGRMLLVSDDLAMAPELVSLPYSYRWTIETFFQVPQADARLPPLPERSRTGQPAAGGRRDPGLWRDHRVRAAEPDDRPPPGQGRDGGPALAPAGVRHRAGRAGPDREDAARTGEGPREKDGRVTVAPVRPSPPAANAARPARSKPTVVDHAPALPHARPRLRQQTTAIVNGVPNDNGIV